jgi:hypothetical protein
MTGDAVAERADVQRRTSTVRRCTCTSAVGFFLLLAPLAKADVVIPVVGRPSTFYDAAGKDVQIAASAEPTELTLDDTIRLTIRVSNLVNAPDVQRPDLKDIEEFRRDFQIIDEPSQESPASGTRVFSYRLRPRHVRVATIPILVFPYYDHTLPQPPDMPDFPFRKVRTKPIAIRVRKAAPPPLPIVPLEVPAFAESLTESSPRIPEWTWWMIVAAPPVFALLWCVLWQATHPLGDRALRRRRSRAARHALRILHSMERRRIAEPSRIFDCVTVYIAEHFDLPNAYRTPDDLARALREAQVSNDTVSQCCAFLSAADAARFAPSTAGASADLLAEAERLVRRLEAEP